MAFIEEGGTVRIMSEEDILAAFDVSSDELEEGEREYVPFENTDLYLDMMKHFTDNTVWWRVEDVDEDGDFSLKMLFGTFPREIVLESKTRAETA